MNKKEFREHCEKQIERCIKFNDEKHLKEHELSLALLNECEFRKKEKENLIDETDGIHIVFGMVIVPYILHIVQNNKMYEINKVFSFLENMAMCEDVKIKEVLDFTVLEQLADEGHDTLGRCKQYMKKNTLKHCEEIEKYFL